MQDDDHLAKVSLEKIVAEKSNIVEKNDQMMQLEEANYELTIVNQAKGIVIERLVELVPEMVGAIQSSTNSKTNQSRLERCISCIEDDVIRSKILQIMRKYKLLS